ncbi:MAG TPA: hypothetical protein VH137_01515, partial [Gemmatimonadales bacterium]|nr:hypothetical protein [Gemmatimonadales bacterium]
SPVARLRALGVAPGEAERLLSNADVPDIRRAGSLHSPLRRREGTPPTSKALLLPARRMSGRPDRAGSSDF